jgi:hypothetical protein
MVWDKIDINRQRRAHDEFMRGLFQCVMLPGVVSVFCDWKKLRPSSRVRCTPGSKVLFQPGIHSFCLAIGSGVERCREILLYSKRPAQSRGKLTGEAWVSVGDDSFRQSKKGDEVHEVKSSHFWSVYGLLAGEEFGCLRTPLINDG